MDDVIQFIILVVTFAAFIISAIFKQKKKPQAKSGFDKALESLLGIPEADPVYAQDFEENVPYEEQVVTVVKKKPAEVPQNKTYFIEGEDAIPNSIQEIVTSDNPEQHWFDARAAFIHSEIINRKYN